MQSLIGDALEAYVHEQTSPESTLLEELRQETHASSIPDPQMQIGRVEGQFLRMMCQLSRAERVLEVGTFTGYSALALASGLPAGGQLITCDVDPRATEMAQRYFDRSPDGGKIKLRLGPALDTLAELAAERATFDLAFIDADKEQYVAYWDAIVPMMTPGGVLLADNALWSGAVLDPRDASDRGVVAFNAHVAADQRVEQVLLAVRDGVMMARKRVL
ncbi:MAG: methyltransferase [Myxococcales bacterium FL481]|nr:MAG: methyltransferase [Myxococcales bacterium FL481]